jgi:hypothetical protein
MSRLFRWLRIVVVFPCFVIGFLSIALSLVEKEFAAGFLFFLCGFLVLISGVLFLSFLMALETHYRRYHRTGVLNGEPRQAGNEQRTNKNVPGP